jgi:wyosine [tRNA(Phe)-imidazoG37] synthetase (radical SAM superfamily)
VNATPHLFGPVPSRRLGRSLGVDLVPFKTCTFDCIYCQLGSTTDLTDRRRAYVDPARILDELAGRLSGGDRPDYITLSGSGEPTLCRGLGELLRGIKRLTDIPVAVLTNGSLLHEDALRQELLAADLVVPSLDAGCEAVYRRVNRPCETIGFDRLVEGLCAFGAAFAGALWLEVFLLEGINSDDDEVWRIAGLADRIGPEKVQLNTVARPPAEASARAVSPTRLEEIAEFFPVPVDVIADTGHVHEAGDVVASREDVLALLRRRPCTTGDIAAGLGIHRNEVVKHLGELAREGRIATSEEPGGVYYRAAGETPEA